MKFITSVPNANSPSGLTSFYGTKDIDHNIVYSRLDDIQDIVSSFEEKYDTAIDQGGDGDDTNEFDVLDLDEPQASRVAKSLLETLEGIF